MAEFCKMPKAIRNPLARALRSPHLLPRTESNRKPYDRREEIFDEEDLLGLDEPFEDEDDEY